MDPQDYKSREWANHTENKKNKKKKIPIFYLGWHNFFLTSNNA
jgi:hypothetical protein